MLEQRTPDVKQAARDAALSGAVSGGLLGAVVRALTPGSWKQIAKAGAAGAGLYGGIAGGSTAIGSGIAGAPGEDEATGFARRGALGGLVGGGAAGAGLGALAAAGKLKLPPGKLAELFGRITAAGGREGMKRGALAGGAAGGLGAAYMGADEGMQLDAITQELARRRRQRALEELSL